MADGDSLLFDNVDDNINFAVGGTPTFGPGAMAGIFKFDTSISGNGNVFTSNYEMFVRGGSDDALTLWDGGAERVGTVIPTAEWHFVMLTKATGTVLAREHKYRYSTGAWTHTNLSSANANVAPGATSMIGSWGGGGFFKGNILIVAVWNIDMADATVEALNLQHNRYAWTLAAPLEGWYCNTMSTINSFGTTGTADETSRTGTTLDVGDVPLGWAEAAPTRAVLSTTLLAEKAGMS